MKKDWLLCLFVIFFFACGHSQQWPPPPEAIHLGEASCAKCRMIITDDRFGAQLHEQGKPVQMFDDYGCFLSNRNKIAIDKSVVYVRSFNDGNWLREDEAFYVVSKHILSPMGYGVAAYATRESAAAFAHQTDDSKIYSITELIPAAENISIAGLPKKE